MSDSKQMGLFNRRIETANFAAAPVRAAAGASNIGNFIVYQAGSDEVRALSNPTVSRSRDLIASLVGSLELKHYAEQWTGEDYEELYLPLEGWMERPDPKVTRQFFMVNIFNDLFFRGRAYAYVTTRFSTGFPASFTWLPAANISSTQQTGVPQMYGPADELEFNGQPLDVSNVIQFLSPIPGILSIGARAINTSIYLDQAADRYAQLETTPGYLQQIDGEDLSGEDLGDLAAAWSAARKANAIGALSRQVQFKEFQANPAEIVAEQRKYQALDMARLCNIPAYLVSAPTEGASMTYQNAQQARQDLYLFGARIYLDTIEQTLSMDNVLPRGRYVEFDVESWINDSHMAPDMPSPVSDSMESQT